MSKTIIAATSAWPQSTRFLYRDAITTSVLAMVSVFFLFKTVYVDPDFSNASFGYIEQAGGQAYLPGYIVFLRALHAIAPSPWVLVAVQYFLLQAAVLALAVSVLSIWQASEKKAYVVLLVLAVNPLSLYVANHLSSDVLYVTLLLSWLLLLLISLRKVSYPSLLLQAVCLAALIGVRYQALWLLPVMLVAVYKSKGAFGGKILSVVLCITLTAGLLWKANAFTKEVRWKQYNNTLYILNPPYVSAEKLPVPVSAAGRVAYHSVPQMEHFTQYSMGRETMRISAWRWFRTRNAWLNCHWNTGSYYLLIAFPAIWILLHLFVAGRLLWMRKKQNWSGFSQEQRYCLVLLIAVLCCNLVFSVSAAPILLRCQLSAFVIAWLVVAGVPLRRAVCS